MIQISDPEIGPEVEDLVLQVLQSGRLAQGPMVERFETLCAEMAGSRWAIAVTSGTTALRLALRAAGVGEGDEVITSPFTFVATLNAILAVGATARFADVGSDFLIDPDAVAPLIGSDTRAILPVHLYGLPADMPRLNGLAKGNGLSIVEDAAQAHGASVADRPAGGWGTGAFSFYATKNVAAGEGGVVTTSDRSVAELLRLVRNQGMVERYHYDLIGENLRMTELQAAVAIPQLERLSSRNARRTENAELLASLLTDADVRVPATDSERASSWHQFTVLLPPEIDRPLVVSRLAAAGIESGIYYPSLVWDHPPYRENPRVRVEPTPVAADMAKRCLSLPIHGKLDADQISLVGKSFLEILEKVR